VKFEYPKDWNVVEVGHGAVFGEVTNSLDLPLRAKVVYEELPEVTDAKSLLQLAHDMGIEKPQLTEIDGKHALVVARGNNIEAMTLRQAGHLVRVVYNAGSDSKVIEEHFKRMLSTLEINTL